MTMYSKTQLRRSLWTAILVEEGYSPENAERVYDRLVNTRGPSTKPLNLMGISKGSTKEYPGERMQSVYSTITKLHKRKVAKFSTMRRGDREMGYVLDVTRVE